LIGWVRGGCPAGGPVGDLDVRGGDGGLHDAVDVPVPAELKARELLGAGHRHEWGEGRERWRGCNMAAGGVGGRSDLPPPHPN